MRTAGVTDDRVRTKIVRIINDPSQLRLALACMSTPNMSQISYLNLIGETKLSNSNVRWY